MFGPPDANAQLPGTLRAERRARCGGGSMWHARCRTVAPQGSRNDYDAWAAGTIGVIIEVRKLRAVVDKAGAFSIPCATSPTLSGPTHSVDSSPVGLVCSLGYGRNMQCETIEASSVFRRHHADLQQGHCPLSLTPSNRTNFSAGPCWQPSASTEGVLHTLMTEGS
eukprot:scaffold3135_cov352-Prasinococcus_capsulatus_cf.AAC.6